MKFYTIDDPQTLFMRNGTILPLTNEDKNVSYIILTETKIIYRKTVDNSTNTAKFTK